MKTVQKAIEFAAAYDSEIAIGGGEPTLHPFFRAILLETICVGKPFIVTNGSIETYALLLAKLAERDIVSAYLSWDKYHNCDMVKDSVFAVFENLDRLWSPHNVGPIKEGRATVLKEAKSEGCCCETWFVLPNGQIKQCGCQDSPIIGNVYDGLTTQYPNLGCYKN
jgi:organic radical activating enzyme